MQISKLQDDLQMERKIMDALAIKTEKVKILTVKLENAEKQVNDMVFEKTAMQNYTLDIDGMLLDIIETWDSMITITVRKHLTEKLRHVFVMLHRLEGKEELFTEEPIISHSEDEEPDENELKRRKAREAEMDEHQRIVREDEAKEKAEIEARVTLEIRKLLFTEFRDLR
ncbi:unnamed protein product [Lactuca saligna]|uniref:Uncharacterized protein n=1 Tax=Lactuca saligna TaxID=75948 RepID=A0AA36EPZ9_LACSI|nr:unnamed protein product [Lactuca saligna]